MPTLREIKDRGRRDLHRLAQVPAFYYAPNSLLPLSVNVRVHNKWDAKGDVQGTSFRFAEMREETDKLVFLFDEVDPERGAVVMISETEGYRVNVPDPRYLQTVTCAVTPLLETEYALFPAPPHRVLAGEIVLPFVTTETNGDLLPGFTADGDIMLFMLIDGAITLPAVE